MSTLSDGIHLCCVSGWRLTRHATFFLEAREARTAFSDAESKFSSTKKRKQEDQDELAELFDPEGLGPEGEWKKLQDLCLSMDTGEYVTSPLNMTTIDLRWLVDTPTKCACSARRRKSKAARNIIWGDASRHSLPVYQLVLIYLFFAVNSPLGIQTLTSSRASLATTRYNITRMVLSAGTVLSEALLWVHPMVTHFVTLTYLPQLHLSCGTENKILTIAEPEKCEYHLTAITPALCLPLEAAESTRQEL